LLKAYGRHLHTHVRCFLALLLFALILPAAAAKAETEIIPLPVFATSRNGGNEYGVMPVFLMKEQNEYVYGIIAPSVIYNGNTGANITFRYLGYPTLDQNYRIFINRSTGIDQEFTGEYWDIKFLDGRFRLYARATYFEDSQYRFFGLTELSREDAETNYANRELAPQVTLGYYLPHNFILSYGEKLRWVTLRRGKVDDLPYIKDDFPGLVGINGGAVWDRRVTLTYDSRDDEVYPSSGWLANLYGELDHGLTHNRVYTRVGLDGRTYISFDDQRFTTVIKGAFEYTGGKNVPYFDRSTIGGENSLRGFGTFRYYDDGFILLNVEERIRLFKLHIFGVWSDWQAAPFVDVGRVYSSFRKGFFNHYQVNPGVGFRAVVKPNVVGRVDFGYGKEGLTAFVGLDFPF
jgi:outer membrane protein assembly factor BamA